MMANKMRLIDANDALKLLRGKCVAKYPSTFLMGLLASATEIEQMPTVDAVPVVRCEKCLYSSQYCDENGMYKCGGIQNENGDCFLMVEPTHFCAFGKLRGKFGAKMDGGNEDG